MKTAAFAALAFIVATGGAFAGSDHFMGPSQQRNAAGLDMAHTASVRKRVKTTTKKASTATSPYNPADSYGQGIWGM